MTVQVEIGKTYSITNKWKKSYVEIEEFKDYEGQTGDSIKYETGWRSGTWQITPQDQEEVDQLMDAQAEDWEDVLHPNEFQEAEMIESWDGCWDDWDFSGVTSKSDEELEAFEEEVMEEGQGWFFDNGWDSADMECYFSGPITVEEV